MSRPRPLIATGSAVAALVAAAAVLPGASLATANAAVGSGRPVGVVIAKGGLVAHATPSTHSPRVASYRAGKRLALDCKVVGTKVDGNRQWYTIRSDASGLLWVSARYVRNVGAAPRTCDPMHGTVAATTTARLNLRQGASVADRKLGQLAPGATLRAVCRTQASIRHNWVLTASGRWVAKGYLHLRHHLRMCM